MKKILFIFLLIFICIIPSWIHAQDSIQNMDLEATVSGKNRMQVLEQSENNPEAAKTDYKTNADKLIMRMKAFHQRIDSITKRISSRLDKISTAPPDLESKSMKMSELKTKFSEIEKLMTALPEQEQKLEDAKLVLLQSIDPKADYYTFRNQIMFTYQLEKQILQRQTILVSEMKSFSN